MAIKKKITFEGNTYNLGNKDRVSAHSLTQSNVILNNNTATGAAAGGSAAATFVAGNKANVRTITVTTQLANTNTYTVTFGTPFDAIPTCVCSGLTNYGFVEAKDTLTITATGNSGTGDIIYVCL